MTDDPISNPGITPTPKVPPIGPNSPPLGEGEEALGQKPFSLAPEAGKEGPSAGALDKPSLMEIARDGAHKQPLTPEEMSGHLSRLKSMLGEVETKLQDPNVTNKFSADHLEALQRNAARIKPDLRVIARETEGEYTPAEPKSGEGVLNYITRWLNGSQQTLSNALNYVSNQKSPNIASYLKLQYSVQRATQKTELFASIIGSTVSGIKTIMSTQLG